MKILLKAVFISFLAISSTFAQNDKTEDDAFFIRTVYDVALTEGQCLYGWSRAWFLIG